MRLPGVGLVLLLVSLGASSGAWAGPPGPSKATHWAFVQPTLPALPTVKTPSWAQQPVDLFILQKLEQAQLVPSPAADRSTLFRRASLDLRGLPPSADEVQAFLDDTRPDAYERWVEKLLASPHYGERWGRWWLDQARYADSNGFNIDAPRSAWPYRDWVIAALNRDQGFDQFILEQLAGDLLPQATLAQKTATGFHRNTLLNQEGGIDLEQFRVESVVDRVNTTGAVLLGLTIGCAQCHDHKYDPISQKEYYQLFAFFNNTDEPSLDLAPPQVLAQREKVRQQLKQLEQELKLLDATNEKTLLAWEKALRPEDKEAFPESIRAALKLPDNGRTPGQNAELLAFHRHWYTLHYPLAVLGDQQGLLTATQLVGLHKRTELEQRRSQLRAQEPAIPSTLVLQERMKPRETYVQLGGDFLRKGETVTAGVPTTLHRLPTGSTASRLDLAKWVISPANPLTSRVLVNRVWQQYFGLGLVETENDFGTQGTKPTHPELLDWLAVSWQKQGWSLKALHRLIVTSATYRQASRQRQELTRVDPRNLLLGRQTRLRLDAESVRDAALVSAGLLSSHIGGPGVFPPQPEGVYRFTQIPRTWQTSVGSERYRRGLYIYFWRSAPYPALTVFDAPDSTTTCTRRSRSNTPLQALTLLNDQVYFELAQGLALRCLSESTGQEERLRYLYRCCLGRTPTAYELSRLSSFLLSEQQALQAQPEEAKKLLPGRLPKGMSAAEAASWVSTTRVLLNLDEFITRE